MAPRIPDSLLPFSMKVEVQQSPYGGEYGQPVEIAKCGYDAVQGTRQTSYQLQDGTTGLVWFNASEPNAFDVPAGSLVTVDRSASGLSTLQCTVNASHPIVGLWGRVHHYELEVR